MTDFKLFQKLFKEYQKKFGLTGYKAYFKYEPFGDGNFADIDINLSDMIATVRLNSSLSDEEKSFRDIAEVAKHEALHLLMGRVTQNGKYRYISNAELGESIEELVFKLEDLIK